MSNTTTSNPHQPIEFLRDDDGIVTLRIDLPGQATNTMTAAFRDAFTQAVHRLVAERETLRGVIITSGKPTFFAGGDLHALLAAQAADAPALFERSMQLKANMRRLETLGRPVVAAINGSALGGGFEICLSCHGRIAIDDPRLQLGLPEVSLGLLPGAGGIVRTTRLLGLADAMPLILDARMLSPRDALQKKLIDALANDAQDLMQQARQWILDHPDAQQPWDRTDYRMPGATGGLPAPLAWLRTTPVALMKQYKGLYPAPEAAFAAAVEGAQVDFESAQRIETRYIVQLTCGQVSKNLITTFFFQMNDIRKGRGRPEGPAKSRVNRLGVLGAGLMGTGIALSAAQRGIPVVLKDIDQAKAEAGKARVQAQLGKLVAKGKMDAQQVEDILALIQPTCDASMLKDCDLAIEAVFEDRQLKVRIMREAQQWLAPDAVLASNTSTLPIIGLAAALERPQNVVGLHFFSPVDRMQLVEMIKGEASSDQAVAKAYDFVQQLGKVPILVRDSRGFYTTRVFGAYTREGQALVGEGVVPATIENTALSLGFPVGPLTVMDEVSMGLAWAVRQQTIADLEAQGEKAPEHPAWTVIDRMVNAFKRPGRAGGGGYYDYPADSAKHLWPELARHFPEQGPALPREDVRDRLLYVQPLEAARCVQEKVIETARDANVGSVLGIGFPRWTGGTLQYINAVGLAAFVRRANELADRYGERFRPCDLLSQMARQGNTFQ